MMNATERRDHKERELRMHLIEELDDAIAIVRRRVARLNERERDYLRRNVSLFRDLVEAIGCDYK